MNRVAGFYIHNGSSETCAPDVLAQASKRLELALAGRYRCAVDCNTGAPRWLGLTKDPDFTPNPCFAFDVVRS